MPVPRTSTLVFLLVAAFAGGAVGNASAGGFSSEDSATETTVELVLSEQGSETPWLAPGDQVTLLVPDLEEPTVVEVPEGLFVEQSGTEVVLEPGGSTYTVDEVVDGAYPVVVAKQVKIPLIGTINVSSTKKPH